MAGGEIPHYDVTELPVVDETVFRPEDLPTEGEAERLDAALLARAQKYLRLYPSDEKVKKAYDAYMEFANAIESHKEVAEDNLIMELGLMEKHYELESYVTELRGKIDELVKGMKDAKKNIVELKKNGNPSEEVIASIERFRDDFARMLQDANDMIADVRAIEGMSGDADLMKSIDAIKEEVMAVRGYSMQEFVIPPAL